MGSYALITAVGPNRPGLVGAISKFILDAGCNLEDSRMAVLGGEFAMLILVEGDGAAVGLLLDGIEEVGAELGLTVMARRTSEPGQGAGGGIPYQVTVYSMDHPGIVRRVSQLLGDRGINVRSLDSRVTSAPISGQPLFSMEMLIDVPPEESLRELRMGLEEIGVETNIDIELRPVD